MSSFQEASALQEKPKIHLRLPASHDGIAVHELIRNSEFLDSNSLYCYLLLCTHFPATSVVAVSGQQRLGVITAYIPPAQPDTLFVWQLAVHPAARGQGLASRMLEHIVMRPGCRHLRFLETTVTADNTASRAVFNAFARRRRSPLSESLLFDRHQHFLDQHDSEFCLRIGPFDAISATTDTTSELKHD